MRRTKTERPPSGRRRHCTWLSIVFLAAQVAGGAASAVCPVDPDGGDDGIGGTGLLGGEDDGDGIGGTGIRPSSQDGATQTAVLGTVTGLGSLCVNARTLEFDASTPVHANLQPASVAQLAVGQVVEVLAEPQGAQLYARRIDIRYAVVGPVAWQKEGVLKVLGQRIIVSSGARTEASHSPEPGEWLAISGLRRPDGVIVATRLDVVAPGRPAALRGSLSVAPGGAIRLAGLDVEWRAEAAATPGSRVLVTGRWNSALERLQVDWAVVEPDFPPSVRRFDLEGYAARVEPDALELAGRRIGTTGVGDSLAGIPRDHRIRVRGSVDATGALKAQSVQRLGPDPLLRAPGNKAPPEPVRGDPRGRNDGPPDRPRPVDRPERLERPQRPDRGGALRD